MDKRYHYEGPIELGSVVAHQCSAVGLRSHRENSHFQLIGREQGEVYVLDIHKNGHMVQTFQHPLHSKGRQALGRELLKWLRRELDLQDDVQWGTLVGVRPTKLVHKLWDQGLDARSIGQYLKETYDVQDSKIDLLLRIGALQRPYLEEQGKKELVSLYAGIPFCETHCTYCSFPYGLIQQYESMNAFLQAYVKDIQHMKSMLHTYGVKGTSLYMGGGTPTSLDDESFRLVLQELRGLLDEGREFTVEAGRPDSITDHKLESMRQCGVNRISINPQTMQDSILRTIRRGHKAEDIRTLYDHVRRHTDFTVNMDFIAGLPGQRLVHMKENLDFVSAAMPHNVTVHALAIKRNSPLFEGHGYDALPPEEEVVQMLEYSHDQLLRLGYVPYYLYRQQYMVGHMQNIGYALPGTVCQYNIEMMEERQSVLSIGPGSTSKWITPLTFRQDKQFLPHDVDVYHERIDELLEKRARKCNEFWRGTI